ncbi:hypothetical protein, partial [Nocardia abscessus]|uniref:hypothetical protein n=1 Tax=Nocardia abscessus TaxID=120957 RepID=UPI0024589B2B
SATPFIVLGGYRRRTPGWGAASVGRTARHVDHLAGDETRALLLKPPPPPWPPRRRCGGGAPPPPPPPPPRGRAPWALSPGDVQPVVYRE